MTTANLEIIDAAVAHGWAHQREALAYMPPGWQEYIGEEGRFPDGGGAITILPRHGYRNPLGDTVHAANDDPRASLATTALDVREQYVSPYGVSRAVLVYREALTAGAIPNPHLSREVCRAANAWTVERWLSDGSNDLFGLIVVSTQDPAGAVREIEHWAHCDRMVGVALGANSLARPFGHPVYHKIYEAAAHFHLPIVVHDGLDVLPNSLSHPTGAGLPSSYADYHSLRAQAVMTCIASFVVQGVFDRFPDLKLVVTGVGTAWLPAFLWRFDTEYGSHVREVPWMQMRPSEYFRRCVRVTTHGIEQTPNPADLVRLLTALGFAQEVLMFGSGYPSWDYATPDAVSRLLPAAWHRRVLRDNALSTFRWPGRIAAEVTADVAVGEPRFAQ
jgi:uncharacterized protein